MARGLLLCIVPARYQRGEIVFGGSQKKSTDTNRFVVIIPACGMLCQAECDSSRAPASLHGGPADVNCRGNAGPLGC